MKNYANLRAVRGRAGLRVTQHAAGPLPGTWQGARSAQLAGATDGWPGAESAGREEPLSDAAWARRSGRQGTGPSALGSAAPRLRRPAGKRPEMSGWRSSESSLRVRERTVGAAGLVHHG